MAELKDLNTDARPTWCPGCGNFGIWNGLKRALVSLGADPSQVVIVGGVGCSGKIPHWVKTYGFHGLHGRTLPVATGLKIANNNLVVIAAGGDGDGYDEGTNHLIHAARRNINVTYIVHNNQVFGLTKGQTSPTADPGYKSKTSPWGVHELPVNPMSLAISAHATFVARGYAADMPHLAGLIEAGVKHQGFALIDILQPCVTFNHHNTYDWYGERIYRMGPTEEGRGHHDHTDIMQAYKRSLEWGDEGIPIGIFYQEQRPTLDGAMDQLHDGALVDKDISNIDIEPLKKKFF